MSKIHNFNKANVFTAVVIAGGLVGMSAQAGSLGVDANVSVGGGSLASVGVSVGGSHGVNADATVGGGSVADANVSVGGGSVADASVTVGGSGSGGGGGTNGGGTDVAGNGGGTPTPGTQPQVTRTAPDEPLFLPTKPVASLVGTVVLSADGSLIGEIVQASMSNGKIRAQVALANSLGVRAKRVVLTTSTRQLKENVLWLSQSRDGFIRQVRNG